MQTRLDKTTISKVNLEMIVDKQTRKLKALVETDTLTHVPNRRAYTHRLNEEKALSIRNNSYLSMMIDIDYFKQFNDG
ncbi:MAG: diguanylate cyclase, partial [Gammaproteobacteria bacterium]|nr:diguanylate cyclase [Gammaproteobacteria bacterium]